MQKYQKFGFEKIWGAPPPLKTKDVRFNFTKKTAPSIGSKLAVLKKMSLGIHSGGTSKYNC